jgi:hypothetical protein
MACFIERAGADAPDAKSSVLTLLTQNTPESNSSMTTRQVASEFGWQSGNESDDDSPSSDEREKKAPGVEIATGVDAFNGT